MVAGDPNAAVGTTIGFVGDVIVPGHVAESVLRASLVYTIAWIPAAAIMGITVVGVGAAEPTAQLSQVIVPGHVAESVLRASLVYTIAWIPAAAIMGITVVGVGAAEPTAQLSQAKGIPGGATVLGQAVPQTTLFAIAYLLSHIAAFVLKTLAHGVPLTEAAWGLAAGTMLSSCLLLCAIYTMSALIAAICRMPLLALFLSLLLNIGPLLAYPRAYIAGNAPMTAWMSPTVWLMHTCSLNISEASLVAGAAAGAGICVIASVLTYAICNCRCSTSARCLHTQGRTSRETRR